MPTASRPSISRIHPVWAVEGGRLTIEGGEFAVRGDRLPEVHIGGHSARVVFASSRALGVLVPAGLPGGSLPLRVEGVGGETAYVDIAAPIATGLHQVDNPAFDAAGRLYVTYSGTRGQQTEVSIFRLSAGGPREPFVTGLVNPTSLAFDALGRLHVSSRFEGTIYRVQDDGQYETVATDLGVACGLAFARDGALLVGDRSGTIFRVAQDGTTVSMATLPPSVAAFHLAIGPDESLYVTAPTLSSHDSIYRVAPDGSINLFNTAFGRPQGLAFDHLGRLHVVEALAGTGGVYRLRDDGSRELVLAGAGLVGLAFDPRGGMVVVSNETVYRLDVPLRPWGLS